jgi:hypothetical protein
MAQTYSGRVCDIRELGLESRISAGILAAAAEQIVVAICELLCIVSKHGLLSR